MSWRVIEGDCIEVMAELDEASVDAVVTDPPYGIRFMGKAWDGADIDAAVTSRASLEDREWTDSKGARRRGTQGYAGAAAQAGLYDRSLTASQAFATWSFAWATEALRVLKPGGHLLSFGGTRTYHRLACTLEDAGFEIRDSLAWLYGSGFPKSLDVSKAIDKAAGAEREVVGSSLIGGGPASSGFKNDWPSQGDGADGQPITAPATPDAERWQGWGTALKPAFEPIVLARKPLSGTVAQNVLEHGTGALNVDGTRIEYVTVEGGTLAQNTHLRPHVRRGEGESIFGLGTEGRYELPAGRWPANVILDPEAAAMLDEQSGERPPGGKVNGGYGREAMFNPGDVQPFDGFSDRGGASRFFYTAKTSRAERELGIREYLPDKDEAPLLWSSGEQSPGTFQAEGTNRAARNHHPTVKPVDLMQWLCRLVTPPGGLVLDPFVGSGSTGIAALREGFDFLGIEREPEYVAIARARIVGDSPLFNVEEEPDVR